MKSSSLLFSFLALFSLPLPVFAHLPPTTQPSSFSFPSSQPSSLSFPSSQPSSLPAATSRPSEQSLALLGSIQLTRPERALRRALQIERFLSLEPLALFATPLASVLEKLRGKKLDPSPKALLHEIPRLLHDFGFRLEQPAGFDFFLHGKEFVAVFHLGADGKTLLQKAKLLGRPLTVRLLPDGSYDFYLPSEGFYVLLRGGTLHIAVIIPTEKRAPLSSPRRLMNRLLRIYPSLDKAIQTLLPQNPCPPAKELCVKFSLEHLASFFSPEQTEERSILAMVQRFFRGFFLVGDLRQGLRFDQSFLFTEEAKPFLSVLRSDQSLLPWLSLLPIETGWVGRAQFDPAAIRSLLASLGGFFPQASATIEQAHAGWKKLMLDAKNQFGLDLEALLASLHGDYGGGFLWDDSMVRLLRVPQGKLPFQGHLRGFFFSLGLLDPPTASAFLQHLFVVYQRLIMRLAQGSSNAQLPFGKLQKQRFRGRTVFRLQIQNLDPFFLATHDRFLFFLGHQDTLDKMLDVWDGKAPAFPSVAGGPIKGRPHSLHGTLPALSAFASKPINAAFLLHPRIFRDLAEWFAPAPVKRIARSLWASLRFAGMRDAVSDTKHRTHAAFLFSPTPLATPEDLDKRASLAASFLQTPPPPSTSPVLARPDLSLVVLSAMSYIGTSTFFSAGLLAAIAIPTFLRFQLRSKASEATTSLAALRQGAIAWYESEHSDPDGNPLRRHFPCHDQGWLCAPQAMPCSNKTPLYPASPKAWDHACWKALKFQITNAHHFRYCYKAQGTGLKSSFEFKAQADLDCDGKLSTYILRGKVDRSTGEVETQTTTRDPSE